jgi:hypothetical protein
MSSARTPPSHKIDKVTNTAPAECSGLDFGIPNSRPRLRSEGLNSQSLEYLGSTTSALSQAPEIRSPRSISNSMDDGGYFKSSSSLLTRPKTSSDEWKVGMAPKPLPKTLHQSDRKVSAESQRPARPGWEWIWVLESNWVKRESSEPLEVPKEKLTPKRLRRSLPVRKTDSVYQFDSQGNSSSSHREHATKLSISDVANTRDGTTSGPSTLPRSGRSTSGTSRISNKLLRVFQYISPTYLHFRSPTGEPEGLYCKTKRGIGVGLIGKSKEVDSPITKSMLWISQNNRMYPNLFYGPRRNCLQGPRQHSKVLRVLWADLRKTPLTQVCTSQQEVVRLLWFHNGLADGLGLLLGIEETLKTPLGVLQARFWRYLEAKRQYLRQILKCNMAGAKGRSMPKVQFVLNFITEYFYE